MREFSNNIAEAFINGLRVDSRQFRSANSLSQARNVRCSGVGLESPVPVFNPFSAEVVSHPFPQLIKANTRIFLCDSTEISIVDPSTDPWTAVPINVVNLDGTQGTITAGGKWELIDLDDDFYLMNGSSVVFTDPVEGLGDQSRTYYVADNIQIKTGAYHQGRAIIGGLDGNSFWVGYWLDMFDQIRELSDSSNVLSPGGIGKNTVFWSSVGANDFPNWLYFPKRAFFNNTEYTDDNVADIEVKETAFYESLLKNEFGFMKMTFLGEVVSIVPLGQNLIVYGRDGITLLSPYLSDQISTYAKQRVNDIGIPSRGAVGGSDGVHIFVDNAGDVWRFQGNSAPDRLGYKEYISALDFDLLTVTYNEHEGDFYISDGSTTFLLTPSGMSEVDRPITSGFHYNGQFTGIDDEPTTEEVLLTTAQYDFGIRAIKAITSVQIASYHTAPLSVAVDYRFSDNQAWSRTDFVPVNKEGGAFIRISGTDFRFVLKCDDNTNFELDYLQIKWQATDKRQIRGAYAGPATS